MVILEYERYDVYQKDAQFGSISRLTNSGYKDIDVSPEVDYIFQFLSPKSERTIFKTQVKPEEIEIPTWIEKWVEYHINIIACFEQESH